jgi:predicted kinase
MGKIKLTKPVLIMMYGFPGAGKTFFARQLSSSLKAVHISSDRIRGELFEKPRYDKSENEVVDHLTEYMIEEFLNAGVSVVYDFNVARFTQRRRLRDLATKAHAKPLLLWFQVDHDTAFTRIMKRDKRRVDDKHAREFDRTGFDAYITGMQNPKSEEDFIVLSGKHSFQMQRSTLVRRLYDLNLVDAESTSSNVTKPGMVNLVPTRADLDLQRRSIRIR